MDEYNKILTELQDEYNKCNELFLIAYNLNNNKYSKTEFSVTVASFMTEIMQTLDYIIDEIKQEENKESILEDADEIESDYN